MSARAAARLYSPQLLALATALSDYPLADDLPLRAAARSRSCGSVITIGLALTPDGRIARIGMQVSACAIGQASAALLAQGAQAAAAADLADAASGIADWLAGQGDLPHWPASLAPITPARDHPGRHGALLLPWTAACEALSHAAPNR